MNWLILLFAILAILLFIITQYYRLNYDSQREKIETFQQKLDEKEKYNSLSAKEKLKYNHNIIIHFKQSPEARKLIKRDSQYIKLMNQPNLLARGCDSQDILYSKYLGAFSDITPNEENTVNKAILNLLDTIKSRSPSYYNYIIFWLNGKISIAKAQTWLEGGMPHTLETTIIMDVEWFINPRMNTFIHEITHIHQRNAGFEWLDLYKYLGYSYINPADIKGIENIIVLNRNNPDGLDAGWLWTDFSNNKWWIGALFYNITPNNLLDVEYVALKLNMDNNGQLYYLKQTPINLNKFCEFNIFFGANINNYHPNEMIAKFSEWYMDDILGNIPSHQESNTSNKNLKHDRYEGYKIYKNYFETMINTYYQ